MKTLRTRAEGALLWTAGFRRLGRRRLAPPAIASVQISASFGARSAQAARLKEPVAALSGLLQTGGSILPRPAFSSHCGGEFNSCRDQSPVSRAKRALIRPSCAPSNQRNLSDKLGCARPFSSSSRLPLVGLGARKTGDGIPLPVVAIKYRIRSVHAVRHLGKRSIPFPHAMPDSDSPWESRSRFFAGRKSSTLRASGALRDEFLFLSPSAPHPV